MLGDIQSALTVIYSTIPEQLPCGPNGKRDHFIEAGGQINTMAMTRE